MQLFPHLLKIVTGDPKSLDGGYGYENFSLMVGYFANFMSIGGDLFLHTKIQNHTFFEIFCSALNRVIQIADH